MTLKTKEKLKEFRNLLDKWGIIATPAPGAKEHTRKMRKAWEQFLLHALNEVEEETIREIEWKMPLLCDKCEPDSQEFFHSLLSRPDALQEKKEEHE